MVGLPSFALADWTGLLPDTACIVPPRPIIGSIKSFQRRRWRTTAAICPASSLHERNCAHAGMTLEYATVTRRISLRLHINRGLDRMNRAGFADMDGGDVVGIHILPAVDVI